MTSHGVGVIGAGPGVSALHLPTLARLPDRFTVVHVADGGSGRAEGVASRVGARHSHGIAALLADQQVEVVAVCSPPERHAEHVEAAVAAGKRAILCEKPIGVDAVEATRAIEACRSAGVALVVGTNHLYDQAWGRAKRHLAAAGGPVRTISVMMSLPPNARYHALVTEAAAPGSGAGRPTPDWADPLVTAQVITQLLLGLAIHDLPLVRTLAPTVERITFAVRVPPIGYAVGYVAGGVAVRLTAVMLPGGADSLWRFVVATDTDRIEIDFPPAFVHRGSAMFRVRDAAGDVIEHSPVAMDGYLEEWCALADMIAGTRPRHFDPLLADAQFAVHLATTAGEWIRGGDRA